MSQDAIPSFRYESDRAPLLDALDYHAYVGEDGNTYSLTKGLPSTGEVKVLVIPVLFKNETVPANLVENINKAFFGTSNDTGWESLSSYYYKSSYGTLNITGTVLEPYSTGNTVRYYDNLYSQYLRDYDAYLNYETDV